MGMWAVAECLASLVLSNEVIDHSFIEGTDFLANYALEICGRLVLVRRMVECD